MSNALVPAGLDQAHALRLVFKITDYYPNGRKGVTKGYIASLVTVLMTYPQVAERAADPVNGVARECKFFPTPAELIAWCDREMAERQRHAERAARARRQAAEREQDEYWERSRQERPTLQQMQEHYGPQWGITIPDRYRRAYRSLTDDDLRQAYPPKDKRNEVQSRNEDVF